MIRFASDELGGKSAKDAMDNFVREAVRLATDYITSRSVAIVIRDRAGNTATGTSTCVHIGPHFLLATAGHVIEDIDDDRIQLIPASELSSSPLSFAGRSCSPSRSNPIPSDVAWIELDPAVAANHRLRFLSLNDLSQSQAADDRSHPFLVHGYPHQRTILSPSASNVESTVSYTRMADTATLHRSLKSYEIATEYPPRDAANHPIVLAPLAHGLSGGGVWWHPRHDETILTTPTDMRLVAINTNWHQATSNLFATRIDEWLGLVARDFPDTASVFERVSVPRG